MKRWTSILIIAALLLSLAGCGSPDQPALIHTDPTETEQTTNWPQLNILFTAGAEGAYLADGQGRTLGYPELAAYRDTQEGQVLLIDGGNAFDAQADHAKDLQSLINALDYDIRVPGPMELSDGMTAYRELTKRSEAAQVGMGVQDEDYVILEMEGYKVGFVGATRPEGMDAQAFYDLFQKTVDDAARAGADFVFAVGCLGSDLEDAPFTAVDLITHTAGLTAFLTGGCVMEGITVTDPEDREIPICGVGTNFGYIGRVTLDPNTGLVEVTLIRDYDRVNEAILDQAKKLEK